MSESNELDDATQLSDRTVLSDKTVLSSGNTAQSAEATTNAAAPSTVKNSAGENAAEKNDTAEGNAEKSTVARSISSASGDGTEVSDETVLSDGTVISETPHARGGAAVGEADKSKGAPTVAIPTLPKRRGGAAAGKAIRGKKSAQAKPSQAKSVQNKSAQSPVQNKTNGEAVSPVSDTGDNTTNNGPAKTGVDLDATQLSSIQHPTTAPAAKIPNVAFPKARTANTPVAAAARPVTANPAVANTNPQTPASADDIAYFKQLRKQRQEIFFVREILYSRRVQIIGRALRVIGRVFTDGNQEVDVFLSREGADLQMSAAAFAAQLEHIPQDSDFTLSLARCQGFQRRFYRSRTRVVAVINDFDPVSLSDSETVSGQFSLLHPCSRLLRRDTQKLRRGDGQRLISRVMRARQRRRNLIYFIFTS